MGQSERKDPVWRQEQVRDHQMERANPNSNFQHFPKDDYALSVLTNAAIQQDHTMSGSSSTVPRAKIRTKVTKRASTSAFGLEMETSRSSSEQEQRHEAGEENIHLQFGTTGAVPSRLPPCVKSGYHGIGGNIMPAYTGEMEILSAESYDDGRGTIKNTGVSQGRARQEIARKAMPFGMIDAPRSTEPEESGRRRKKPRIESVDEEEEITKTARGRPRVDTKDETAADRRRTQIRMAQRAYRHRKETTISSLEKQVQDLRSTNEEMSSIFINLYDFAISKGLLHREPEFGQKLQSATEHFLSLAKSTQHDDLDEHNSEDTNSKIAAPEGKRRTKIQQASPKNYLEDVPTACPEPAIPTWGGYEVSIMKDDTAAIEERNFDNQQTQRNSYLRDNVEVIARPTEDNASFPFDLMDLQSHRVEIPATEKFSQSFYPSTQLNLPNTGSFLEHSFARRLSRTASENAIKLFESNDPRLIARRQQVFGFCLLFETPEAILTRARKILARTSKDSIQDWRQPFVHLGGAGTYYPVNDTEAGDEMPKFRTGYSMGPFSPNVLLAQEFVEDGMQCTIPGFEGQLFDPNDVEGYLRRLDIVPTSDIITASIDLAALVEDKFTGNNNSNESFQSIFAPPTPQSPVENALPDMNHGTSKPLTLPFPLGFTEWNGITGSAKESTNSLDPKLDVEAGTDIARPAAISPYVSQKTTVILNVQTLVDELLARALCLGRSPGFRPSDVNAAILATVNAGL